MHTTMSDGHLSLAEVVGISEEVSRQFGIADHVSSRNRRQFVSDEEKLRAYLAALEAAPVLRSAELCWADPFAMDKAEWLADELDYVIGSNHGFELDDGTSVTPWSDALPGRWANRLDEVMDLLVDNLCRLVTTMPIAIVAHSTLLPAALARSDPDPERWWSEEREDRFVDAVVSSGVAMEISNRYRLPHDRILRKARERGATFSLGSDGHTRAQIGRLEWSVETADRVGISTGQLFVAMAKRPI